MIFTMYRGRHLRSRDLQLVFGALSRIAIINSPRTVLEVVWVTFVSNLP